MSDLYPELLADLAFNVCRWLTDRKVPAEVAQAAGKGLAEHVRTHWGGQQLYVRDPQRSLFDKPEPADGTDRRTPIIRDVESWLVRALDPEIGPQGAAELGREVARFIETDWAAEMFYIPKGQAFVSDRRKREIFARFNGLNREELSREYGLSNGRLYQICAEMRERVKAERNLRLF